MKEVGSEKGVNHFINQIKSFNIIIQNTRAKQSKRVFVEQTVQRIKLLHTNEQIKLIIPSLLS